MHFKALAAAFAATMTMSAYAGVAAPAPEVVEEDPAKFFLFHMDGISFDVAKNDLSYCIGQAEHILSLRDREPDQGFLAALISGRMAEIDRLRMRNASMRKCMGAMGYSRYQIPAAEWKVMVNEGDIVLNNKGKVDPEVVDRMAKWASGPTPSSKKLDI